MLSLSTLIRRQYQREWRLYLRQTRSWMNAVMFWGLCVCLFPLTLPAEPNILRLLAPSMVWVAVLFAGLLSVERLFQQDYEEGILDQWLISGYPISPLVFAKVSVHWMVMILPLLILTPILSVLFVIQPAVIGVWMLSLLLGTPAIVLICALAAALGITLQNKGVLMGLIVLPLTVPAMILGSASMMAAVEGETVGGYLAYSAALSCLMLAVIPFAIAGILRDGQGV